MPLVLAKEPFGEDLLHLVRDFFCGDEPWARFASNWIKSPKSQGAGGIYSIHKRGTEVWLYFDPEGRLVGFGALGRTKWRWPFPDGPKTEMSIIPQMGISVEFHSQPRGSGEIKYSHKILRDLIARALTHGTDKLALLVNPGNHAARHLYGKHDFHELPEKDRHGNIEMIRLLR